MTRLQEAYRAGFMAKCAEYGITPGNAQRMMKQASSTGETYALPSVLTNYPSFWADASEYTKPIDLTSTDPVRLQGVHPGDIDRGPLFGFTGDYDLPGGLASTTNSPEATAIGYTVTPPRKGFLGFGAKPAVTNQVPVKLWEKAEPGWWADYVTTLHGNRILEAIAKSQATWSPKKPVAE